MYNQGMTFGVDGPIMSGTWYNPKTGDKFTVADTFFEDNQLLVRAVDGRLLNYNIIQDYIQQGSTDIQDTPQSFQTQKSYDIPKEIADMIETPQTGFSEMVEPMGNLYAVQETNFQSVTHTNSSIIDKALSKTELPKLNLEVSWEKYPEREIEMLKDIMDIPVNDIIEWYASKFDLTTIKKQISEAIQNTLNPAIKDEISIEGNKVHSTGDDLPVERKKTRKNTKK